LWKRSSIVKIISFREKGKYIYIYIRHKKNVNFFKIHITFYRIKREAISKKLTCIGRVGKDWSEDGGTDALLDG
jgi:hypothetical protein